MATGNIAKNDITGRFIKSAPPTANYTANFDAAFKKKTLREWYVGEDIVFNDTDDKSESLVSYSEFKTHFKNNQ